jgi:hypothetical protein
LANARRVHVRNARAVLVVVVQTVCVYDKHLTRTRANH